MIKHEFKVYSQSVCLPDSCSGGPDLGLATNVFYGELSRLHASAVKEIERRIAATEKRLDQQAVDKSYLSGFTVKAGKAHLQVRVSFKLKDKLRSVK